MPAVPWQFRKRINLGPGVRLNIGKSTVSLSVGGPLARVSVNSKGEVYSSQTIPGTGLYRRQKVRLGWQADAPTPAPPYQASPAEAAYADGMQAYLSGDFPSAYEQFTRAIKQGIDSVSADFYAGNSAVQQGLFRKAIPHLERVVQSEMPLPDELMYRYAPTDRVRQWLQIAVVEGVYATLPIDSVAATLLLAEMYQYARQRDAGITLLRELIELWPDHEAVRLSLCDLLYEAADFDGVIAAAEPAAPQTTLGLACRIFKAQAQGHLGDFNGCRLTVEAALATTEAEDPKVLKAARDALVVAYQELGIPLDSLDRFMRALNPTRVARRPDPGVQEVSYENEGMKDLDDAP